MSRCPGCGGMVGVDCWNPQECEWIMRDMASRASEQQEQMTACSLARWRAVPMTLTEYLTHQAAQAEADGNLAAAQAIREYAEEMES